jgi:hypothetical protein
MPSKGNRLTVQPGQILTDGAPMRCKVRHLTPRSATIQTLDAPLVPVAFGLRVPGLDIEANCRVVWRDQRRIGVAFF